MLSVRPNGDVVVAHGGAQRRFLHDAPLWDLWDEAEGWEADGVAKPWPAGEHAAAARAWAATGDDTAAVAAAVAELAEPALVQVDGTVERVASDQARAAAWTVHAAGGKTVNRTATAIAERLTGVRRDLRGVVLLVPPR